MRLILSRNGRMVHLPSCRYSARGLPWEWAEHQSGVTIVGIIERLGYQTCRICDPLGLHWNDAVRLLRAVPPRRAHLRLVK